MNSAQSRLPISKNASQEPTAYDDELLRAARSGSHTAFAELQSIYARRLYRRVFSITGNHEDAEDALQDTFLRAYRALPSFEGRSRFSSWLTRIAINSALMTIRRRRARPETFFGHQPGTREDVSCMDIQDDALNPEQICDQKQRSEAIMHALRRLDPKLRVPMQIWISDEHSMKELAQHLGISLASVKARLHRARKHILRSQALRKRDTLSARAVAQHSRCTCGASLFDMPNHRLSESHSPRCKSSYARGIS